LPLKGTPAPKSINQAHCAGEKTKEVKNLFPAAKATPEICPTEESGSFLITRMIYPAFLPYSKRRRVEEAYL
jgi:hypothetical protein